MFLDRQRKTLDYNFLLWKFDTTNLDVKFLLKLEGVQLPEKEIREEDLAFANYKDLKCTRCSIF